VSNSSVSEHRLATPSPSGRARLVDTQSFVFWVFAVVAAYSGIHLFSAITANPTVVALPAISWMSLVVWTLYGVAFAAFVYHHQLFVRRAASVTIGALLWGGVVATWFSAQGNAAMQDTFDQWFDLGFNDRWGVAISAATNEELLKTLGLVVLVLLPMTRLRNTLDGWFYGVMIGLGFQVVEDFIFTVNQSTTLDQVVSFFIQRGFFAGLWAHAVYSGIVGIGVGYFVSRKDRSLANRLGVVIGTFVITWLFHFLWDAQFMNDWLSDLPAPFLMTILMKGVPALVTMLLLLRWTREQERPVWVQLVKKTADPTLVSEAHAAALLSRRTRRAARKAARATGGRHAAHAEERLQRAQLSYVQCLSEEGPLSERATQAAQLVRDLRSPAPA
jgi:protease PrsW